MPKSELALRLTGLALVAAGAIGLTVTVFNWASVRDCIVQNEGRLALCATPLPAVLFGLWFLLGTIGTYLATRR